METIKKYKRQILFHLLLNLVIGLFITLSSYYHVPLRGVKDYFIHFIHFLLLQFTVFSFTYIVSINKYVFYTVFSILFILFSLFSYFVYTQDLSATDAIIQTVLETKLDIAVDVITAPFIFYFFLIMLVLIIILTHYKKLNTNPLKSPLLILSIVGVVIFFIGENYKLGVFKRRMPYSLSFRLAHYFQKEDLVLSPIKTNITYNRKDINVVFVLGESVRANHLQVNGYKRATTPFLSNNNNIVSFPKIYTPHTATTVSVPQILTNQSIKGSTKNVFSIYSILKKINLNSIWIGNQTPEKSYNTFIKENKKFVLIDKFRSVLSFNKKLDEEMLPVLKSNFKINNKQFITLHMIGSHWWYENRYSNKFRKYTPVINSKYIPSLKPQTIINSYDNTLVYLDNFLEKTTSIVKGSKTILIYLSDHGEVLGENGKWLHAQDNDASKNPAMIVWYSDEFKTAYPELVLALKENKNKRISTDFFYHSILDLLQVQNFDYEKEKSIFRKENY